MEEENIQNKKILPKQDNGYFQNKLQRAGRTVGYATMIGAGYGLFCAVATTPDSVMEQLLEPLMTYASMGMGAQYGFVLGVGIVILQETIALCKKHENLKQEEQLNNSTATARI